MSDREGSPTRVLPMFPLGTVLVPHGFLPLHVFEPRYRALTMECLTGDREFGVVLIERGSEVGGGDQRFSVGTVARIVEAVAFDDGRYGLATVGASRVGVVEWLPDDPYPRARVAELPDAAGKGDLAALLADAEAPLRTCLRLATELGEPVAPMDVALDADVGVAAWQLVAVSPLGPADQQRLLEAPDTATRLRLAAGLLAELADVLAHRLANG